MDCSYTIQKRIFDKPESYLPFKGLFLLLPTNLLSSLHYKLSTHLSETQKTDTNKNQS